MLSLRLTVVCPQLLTCFLPVHLLLAPVLVFFLDVSPSGSLSWQLFTLHPAPRALHSPLPFDLSLLRHAPIASSSPHSILSIWGLFTAIAVKELGHMDSQVARTSQAGVATGDWDNSVRPGEGWMWDCPHFLPDSKRTYASA